MRIDENGRYLVAAPMDEVCTSLLYYDNVIFPGNEGVMDGYSFVMDRMLRTDGLLETLGASGLYVSVEHLVVGDSAEDQPARVLPQALLQWDHTVAHDPRDREAIATRQVACELGNWGLRVSSGYDSSDAFAVGFPKGSKDTVAIVFKQLPVLDIRHHFRHSIYNHLHPKRPCGARNNPSLR